ncbi:MAG: LacI family DNA-binding transcriptional regulator [Acidimicrobiia bacterium]
MNEGDASTGRRPGKVTLQDVADEAGVHPSTVSRALDPDRNGRVKESTRELVVEVARRLGYRPDMVARGLQSGRTGTVGVVVADLGNTFVTPLLHGVAAAIETSHMLSVVAESQDDHDRLAGILDHLLSRRVDGMIVLAARTGDQQALEEVNRSVPVVLASRPLEDTPLCQVTHDNERGGRLVAEHLQALGHRRVAQLEGPSDVLNFPRRALGFRSVVSAHGLAEIEVPGRADRPSLEEGRRLMGLLLETSPEVPTAVFAHNDLMALGALAVLRERGVRVPDDISLVGYNDMPLVAHVAPPLSTVRYDSFAVGRWAGERLLGTIRGEGCDDVVLDPVLVPRGSSRRIG